MNSDLTSSQQNALLDCGGMIERGEPLKPKIASTSQRKVRSRNKIIITKPQRHWAAYLYKQYGLPVPGWLRTTFIINQRRRKSLNDILREANLGSEFCGQCQSSDDWSYHLHSLWHIVNGGSPCV